MPAFKNLRSLSINGNNDDVGELFDDEENKDKMFQESEDGDNEEMEQDSADGTDVMDQEAGNGDEESMEEEMECSSLRKLETFSSVSTKLFLKIARMCPKLRKVAIDQISEAGNSKKSDAIEIVKSLSALGSGRKMKITCADDWSGVVWKRKSVKAALKKMKKSGGPNIRFESY